MFFRQSDYKFLGSVTRFPDTAAAPGESLPWGRAPLTASDPLRTFSVVANLSPIGA